MKKLRIYAALAVLALAAPAALAQTPTPTNTPTNTPTATPTNTPTTTPTPPPNPNTGTIFLPALQVCSAVSSTTAPVATRIAANDWALARTAGGAETISFRCDLSGAWLERHLNQETNLGGVRILSINIVHSIVTTGLTTDTLNGVDATTYANNTADSVASFGGTKTAVMPLDARANPYLTTVNFSAPAYLTSGSKDVGVDWTVVTQNGTVYRLHGIAINYVKNAGARN